jgi:hypothetical protein
VCNFGQTRPKNFLIMPTLGTWLFLKRITMNFEWTERAKLYRAFTFDAFRLNAPNTMKCYLLYIIYLIAT